MVCRSSTAFGPLASVVLRPFATQILGDLSADVITVENSNGDMMRYADRKRVHYLIGVRRS